MKSKFDMKTKMFRFLLCLFTGVFLSTLSARANVYATDIRLSGSLSSITTPAASPVTISYRLNQAATLGVTVSIFQGANLVATVRGGTNMGLNTVVWGGTNSSGTIVGSGTYSFSITAAASGFTNWQQISVDANAGNYALDPNGIAVDNNANSPYYGRVVVGCSFEGGTNPISGTIIQDGIYKMNADGSFADEGGFGYGGYTMDDGGHLSTNEMPSFSQVVPWRLRIGDDDRIYMLDYSDEGAISAFDMQVTTFQVVIDDGGSDGGALGGPHNYSSNPDLNDLFYGINNFDVTSTTTSNAAVWLCDFDNSGNWGIWMYHLVNGQSATNDTGTQAVKTGGDLSMASSGGCTVDANLDIFCGQSENNASSLYYAMVFTNWNAGILPPASSLFSFADGTAAGEVAWGYGCGVDTVCATDPTFEGVQDVVVNSRISPTLVACPMETGGNFNNGIRVLNATNGSIVLTNLDFGQEYSCAAWDNVGNLYAASPSTNRWRVWSPPGTSTNTTVAVAQVIVTPGLLRIDTISEVRTGPGSANVTINFTAPGNPAPTVFTIIGSPTVNGVYASVTGAVINGSSGAYQATFSSSSTAFYKVKQMGQ